MANNLIQIKRTSVSGRAANTSTLSNAGELALNMTDGIMYSTNGSVVFEIGANNTNAKVSGNLTIKGIIANGSLGTSGYVLKSNGSAAYWDSDGADVGAANQILYRNSSNVLTSSSGLVYDGVSIKVNGNLESLYNNGSEGGEIFLNKPASGTTLSGTGVTIDIYENKIRFFENGGTVRGAYIDLTGTSAGVGTNLVSGGGGGSVNTSAQYTWTNTHIFQANVAFNGNNITVVSNTGSVMFAGTGDTNWRIGRSTGAFTKRFYSNNTLDFIAANSNLEGIAFGYTGSEVYLETGYNGTYTKNPVYIGTVNSTSNGIVVGTTSINIGNSSVNSTINSTAFTGTALSSNNASFLGSVAAASYVQNTDSRTLSGNLNFTGANNNFSGNLTIASTGELIITSGAGIYANGSLGTTGQVLTTDGTTVYWAGAAGGFTNGTSISVNNFVVTGSFTANSSNGTSGQVLTSSGSGVYWANAASSVDANSQSFTGNGTNTVFTLATSVSDQDAILVTLDGLLQAPNSDYTASGTTLTFTSAPISNTAIEVRYIANGGTGYGISTGKAIAMAIVFGG